MENTLDDFHSIISGYIQVGFIPLCLIITGATVRSQSAAADDNSGETRVSYASMRATYPRKSRAPKVCHAPSRTASPRRLSWSVWSTRHLLPIRIVLWQSRKVRRTYPGPDVLSNLHYLSSTLVFLQVGKFEGSVCANLLSLSLVVRWPPQILLDLPPLLVSQLVLLWVPLFCFMGHQS